MTDLTFVTAHFADFDWTRYFVQQVVQHTPGDLIREILIVDQDRTETSQRKLARLSSLVRVVRYPRSEEHFRYTRHDHAAVLNRVMHEAAGSFVCLFDSDAHPVSDSWLERCRALLREHDAVLAEEPAHPGRTHPCFMVMPREIAQMGLAFDEDLFVCCMDTGRLIGQQIRNSGKIAYLAEPSPAFSGLYGSLYLDSIYHHGKGSYRGVADELFQRQLRWEHSFFRSQVLERGTYALSPLTRLEFLSRRISCALKRRILPR